MSVQRTESGRKANVGSARTEPTGGVPSDTANKMADLMLFIQGQSHQPDASVQLDDITQDINLVMDDDLIEALSTLEEHYVYDEGHASVHAVPAVYRVRELLNQLRALQKTRLRDALQRLMNHPN